jgi:hypothetical protein
MNLLALVKQEDVFRSLKTDLTESGCSSSTMIGLLAGGIGLLLVLAFFSRQNKRQAAPKAVNHEGKLLKEIFKNIPLKPAEHKQLRLLASAYNAHKSQDDASRPAIDNPLVMLLCPSLFARSIQVKPPKIDKKLVAGMALKMGLVQRPTPKNQG